MPGQHLMLTSLNEAFGDYPSGSGPPMPASIGPNSSSRAAAGFAEHEPPHEIGTYDGMTPEQLRKHDLNSLAKNMHQDKTLQGPQDNATANEEDFLEDFEQYVNGFSSYVEKFGDNGYMSGIKRDEQDAPHPHVAGAPPGQNRIPMQPVEHTRDHHQVHINSGRENFAPLNEIDDLLSHWVDIILLICLGIFLIFVLEYTRNLR